MASRCREYGFESEKGVFFSGREWWCGDCAMFGLGGRVRTLLLDRASGSTYCT